MTANYLPAVHFLPHHKGSNQDAQSLRFSLPHTPSVFNAVSALIIRPLQLLIMNLTLLVSTISNPKLISM